MCRDENNHGCLSGRSYTIFMVAQNSIEKLFEPSGKSRCFDWVSVGSQIRDDPTFPPFGGFFRGEGETLSCLLDV